MKKFDTERYLVIENEEGEFLIIHKHDDAEDQVVRVEKDYYIARALAVVANEQHMEDELGLAELYAMEDNDRANGHTLEDLNRMFSDDPEEY